MEFEFNNLKKTRENLNLSQKEVADFLSIPLRTYVRYENDEQYGNNLKRIKFLELLKEKYEVNEEKGILTLDFIKETVTKICESKEFKGKIQCVYLFGSYAKGYQKEGSDVDLAYSGNLDGLEYFGLIEAFRVGLHKRVDLLDFKDCLKDYDILNEILKNGIKIYG